MLNTTEHKLTDENKKIISQALWDMNLSPEEFLDIIEGRSDRKWPERGFCVARLLESVNWFDIVKIVEPKKICVLWDDAKRYVRFKEIKEGMDFACRILH
jgi:hypothetical protein